MSDVSPSATGLCAVLGAPRSGTTWLQRILAASPAVVTPQETHLFRAYLQPQVDQWETHQRRIEEALAQLGHDETVAHRIFGLPSLLDREDLLASQRLLVTLMERRALATKPSARWVLEKTPSNSLSVDLIEEVRPGTRYVHIVRDPRDVILSMRAAGRSWALWAPTDAAGGARMWRRHVEGARRAKTLAPDRYLEVRYEDLRRDAAVAIQPILDMLGLGDDAAELVRVEKARQSASLPDVFAFRDDLVSRLASFGDAEPTGFRRNKSASPELHGVDLRVVNAEAGQLARDAGYGSGWPSTSTGANIVWLGAAWTQRIVGQLGRYGRRWSRARDLQAVRRRQRQVRSRGLD